MKKIKLIFCLLLIILMLFTAGCQNPSVDEVKIESVSVITETIPTDANTTNVLDKLGTIQIKIIKSDKKEEIVNLNKEMLATEDLNKLVTAGTHTINFKYEEFDVSFAIEVKEDIVTPIEKIPYSVNIKDIAGKPLSDFYVTFYSGDERVSEGYTNNTGTFSAELLPNKYEVIVEGREGYYLNVENFETDLIGTPIDIVCALDSLAGKEANEDTRYELGDLMYDFTLNDIDGNVLTLYELLKEKKAVILNFWYTTCSACYYEFPYMVEAYGNTYTSEDGEIANYSDDIAIIAINPGIAGGGDTLEEVKNFRDAQSLNFNVTFDYDLDEDSISMEPALTTMFGIEAYPTTIVIDQYGLIAEIGVGAVTDASKWRQLFDTYISSDYEPTYIGTAGGDSQVELPDITQEESAVLEAAINGVNADGSNFTGNWYPETNEKDAKYSWPWIVSEFDGKTVIKPSNKDKNSSYSIVYTKLTLKAGDVFTFDYYASSEQYDKLYITYNDIIATSISGISPNWEKSFAFVAEVSGEYEFGFCYMKDSSYASGDDCVYITNVRIETSSNIDKETYVFRECAYGQMNEITMSYSDYATVVYNEEDGYYHVNTKNGPLLLADMLSGTKWNSSDLYSISVEGLCIGEDGNDYNKLIEKYSVYANNSTIGYCPVTLELANALKQVTTGLGDELAKNNENQWLEVCVYYSAYGTDGVELGLPTIGVCPFEPVMFEGDGINAPATANAEYDRIILPRGIIFGFIPTKSGVYKYYSTEEVETIGWICDDNGDVIAESDMGLRTFAIDATNGVASDINFVSYIYLEANKLYLFRACFYDIYEYQTISVEMSYVQDKMELLTIASPGFFTSSDDNMSDIISGNYIDAELGNDGYYQVVGSKATDKYLYCDFKYLNSILSNYTLEEALNSDFAAFDFSKDEYGYPVYDEEGYLRYTGFDDDYNIINYYVCSDVEGNLYYTTTLNEGEYTEENGYTYIKLTQEEMENMKGADCTDYVKQYLKDNMVTDENSELYGCVKVDERFAMVLSMLMDKYTFSGVEFSWLKLCYYYKYVGA